MKVADGNIYQGSNRSWIKINNTKVRVNDTSNPLKNILIRCSRTSGDAFDEGNYEIISTSGSYFEINITNTTAIENQTVLELGFDDCSVHNTTAITFWLKDYASDSLTQGTMRFTFNLNAENESLNLSAEKLNTNNGLKGKSD